MHGQEETVNLKPNSMICFLEVSADLSSVVIYELASYAMLPNLALCTLGNPVTIAGATYVKSIRTVWWPSVPTSKGYRFRKVHAKISRSIYTLWLDVALHRPSTAKGTIKPVNLSKNIQVLKKMYLLLIYPGLTQRVSFNINKVLLHLHDAPDFISRNVFRHYGYVPNQCCN